MPAEERNHPMPEHEMRGSIAALGTRVDSLESDVREANSRLQGLDEKFDRVMSGFASEFRSAVAGLSTQFSERNKTPWAVLISGAGIILAIVSMLGHQTLTPITDILKQHETNMVPRKEVEFRYSVNERRLMMIEDDLRKQQNQKIEALERENSLLRSVSRP